VQEFQSQCHRSRFGSKNLTFNVVLTLKIFTGSDMAAAKKIAMEISRDKGMPYINGYDHPHIMSGQGTIGLEIVEQIEGCDAVVVPVGGGGLIAGIATAVKTLSPSTKIIVSEIFQISLFRVSNPTNVLHSRKQWNTEDQFTRKITPLSQTVSQFQKLVSMLTQQFFHCSIRWLSSKKNGLL
jgi:cysteine synthase